MSVYEWDLGLNRAALGLRKLHKLREEHIKMSPRNRMRVKLAAQVSVILYDLYHILLYYIL